MSRTGGKFLKSYKEVWTTGVTLVVTHNLGSLDVLVVVREIDSGALLTLPVGWGDNDVGVVVDSTSQITLTGAAAPTGSGIAVSVVAL
jgi:hypothetical protein